MAEIASHAVARNDAGKKDFRVEIIARKRSKPPHIRGWHKYHRPVLAECGMQVRNSDDSESKAQVHWRRGNVCGDIASRASYVQLAAPNSAEYRGGMSCFRFRLGDKTHGPFSAEQMRKFLASGLICSNTLVQADDGAWSKAKTLAQLMPRETPRQKLNRLTHVDWPKKFNPSVAVLMLLGSVLLWILGEDSSGPLAWIGAAGTIWLGLSLVRNRWRPKLDYRYVLAATLALFGCWTWCSSYWTSDMHAIDNVLLGIPNFTISEQRSRWGNVPLARRVYTLEGDAVLVESGPLRNSQPHGKWTVATIDAQRIGHKWFWNGEAVTQAEWQRRANR